MTRRLHALLPLLLAGCAAAPRTIPPVDQERVLTEIETGTGADVRVESWAEASILTTLVPVPPQRAWEVLQEVHAALELPVNLVDPGRRIAGVREARVRRLAGRRLSAFLDCGSGMAGQHADLYEVHATLVTQIIASGEGTSLVRTRLDASAKDPAHGSPPVRCTSNRRLEKQVADGVRERASAATGAPDGR